MAQVGEIINITDFTENQAQFTGGETSVNAGRLVFAKNAGSVSFIEKINSNNCFESYRITVKVRLQPNTDFGIGVKGYQVYRKGSIIAGISTSNNTLYYATNANVATSNNVIKNQLSVPVPANVEIELSILHTRFFNTIVLKCNNSVFTIENIDINWNASSIAMFISSGIAEISQFKVELLEEQSPEIIFIGDSITKASSLTVNDTHYTRKHAMDLGILPHRFSVHAAGSSTHADLLAHVVTMVNYQDAVKVFILLGDNDSYNDMVGWIAERQSMNALLIDAGVNVVNLTNTPEVYDAGYAIIKNKILELYPAAKNIWIPLQRADDNNLGNTIYYRPDGVHPNSAGNQIIANTLNL